MANKTYNQYCAIAHALDIVGERWTLLVVRNLLAGPKRFSDLMKGLPGISTNILTDRLKSLEENGVITNRYLPPPAASTVYELTELGFALSVPLGVLAQWGARSLGKPQPDQNIVTESIIFMILGMFWREQTADFSLTCKVHVADQRHDHAYWVRLTNAGVEFLETQSDVPDVMLRMGLETLLRLSSGQITLQSAIETGLLDLESKQPNIDKLISWVDAR